MIGVLGISLLLGFSGAIVPGPLFAITVNQALLVGWSAGFWLIVGHMLAELALLLLLRVGLGGFLRRPAATRMIAIIGGMVLLYFAWGMITCVPPSLTAGQHTPTAAMTAGILVGQGVLLTLVNPYWYLWWATAGIGLIGSQVEWHGNRAWPAFFAGHSLADFAWYIAAAILIDRGGAFLNATAHRALIVTCGVGIALLGILFVTRPLLALRNKSVAQPTTV